MVMVRGCRTLLSEENYEYLVYLNSFGGRESPGILSFVEYFKAKYKYARKYQGKSSRWYVRRMRRVYYLAHKKWWLEQGKQWEVLNREKALARFRRYHQKHRVKISNYNKWYYKSHRDEILSHKKKCWRKKHHKDRRKSIGGE